MQDAPHLAHARGRDNDHWFACVVERFGLLDVTDIAQHLETERVTIFKQMLTRLLVVAFRVVAEDLRHIHRQRTVNEDRNRGNLLRKHQLVQRQDDLLRPPDRERRNDDLPAAFVRAVDHAGQLLLRLIFALVQAPAVGAFHDQVVHGRKRFGVTNDRQVLAADVPREGKPNLAIADLLGQDN